MREILLRMLDQIEDFADLRGGRRKWETATNAYQKALAALYEDWSRTLADDLEQAESDEERDAILAASLVVLAQEMRRLGRESISGGMLLVTSTPSPALLADIAQMMANNEDYIDNSLVPDIRYRVQQGYFDPDVVATGAIAFLGILAAMQSRVESYAGTMWTTIQRASADEAVTGAETGELSGRVGWVRDAQAQHCDDCLEFGEDGEPGRVYDSYEDMLAMTGGRLPGQVRCSANCRCWIVVEFADGDWGRP